MRRFSVLTAVALLAFTGLLVAAAYSSATVVNEGTVAVVNTSDALLSLRPGTGVGNRDLPAYVEGGVLRFDFRRGFGGTLLGVQPNSAYQWNELFWIWNRSEDSVEFTIEAEDLSEYIDVGIPDSTPRTQWWHWISDPEKFVRDGVNRDTRVTIAPNTSIPILVRFEVPKNASPATFRGQLTVRAWAR